MEDSRRWQCARRGTIGATCRGCHMVHRATLPDMTFEIQ